MAWRMEAQPFEEAEFPWISQGRQEAAQGMIGKRTEEVQEGPTRHLASLGLTFGPAHVIVGLWISTASGLC